MKIRPLALSVALSIACVTGYAQNLTTYVTEWSGTNGYPFEGSHPSAYHDTSIKTNPDMVHKAAVSHVLTFAFFQAWNDQLIKKYNVPASYEGMLHFSDLWADLPSNLQGQEYTTWHDICTKMSPGSCTTIQLNGMTGQQQFFDYNTTDVGQMSNFVAFLKLQMPKDGKKIISIGGANLANSNEDLASISAKSFDEIFTHENTFLTSFRNFITVINHATPSVGSLDGIDYDFEPRIDSSGAQQPALDRSGKPIPAVVADYQKLYKLIQDTRKQLPNSYISVTITSNLDYLKAINSAVAGGWFKAVEKEADAINFMTYDMHGPWGPADPGTLPHEMLSRDKTVVHNYAIEYGVSEVVQQLKSYGVAPQKIHFGLATYGRGFGGVPATTTPNHPGLSGYDQSWTSASHFEPMPDPDRPDQPLVPIQDGLLPYKDVNLLLADPNHDYKNYEVTDQNGSIIGAYIYSAQAKQFVGYISPHVLSSLCAYSKDQNLGGAIVWSMDSDASYSGAEGPSLIDQYAKECA